MSEPDGIMTPGSTRVGTPDSDSERRDLRDALLDLLAPYPALRVVFSGDSGVSPVLDTTLFRSCLASPSPASAALREWLHLLDRVKASIDSAQAELSESLAAQSRALRDLTGNSSRQPTAAEDEVTRKPARKSFAKDPAPFAGASDSFRSTDGHYEMYQRCLEYSRWKLHVLLRWEADDGHEFASERDKMLHICSLLKDNAFLYVYKGFEKLVNFRDQPEQWPWRTGGELLGHLSARYGKYWYRESRSDPWQARSLHTANVGVFTEAVMADSR